MSTPNPRSAARAPVTIVLLGGIASGKSTIAALLEKRGALVLDADRIAHEELTRPEVAAAIRARWGDGVLAPDGRVDRKRLGAAVFPSVDEVKALEAIIHPRVLARIAARLSELAAQPGQPRRVVVLDVPLAAEAGLPRADLVIFVDAGLDVRQRRARELRGWPEGELERRESRQLSCAEKRAMADATVPNDRGVPEAESHVQRIWSTLVEPKLQAPVEG